MEDRDLSWEGRENTESVVMFDMRQSGPVVYTDVPANLFRRFSVKLLNIQVDYIISLSKSTETGK